MDDTKLCNNCKREVAASNFLLHETHCFRHLSLCPLCDEPVPRDEMKEHQETEHSQVRCKLCNEFVESCTMGAHETDECMERQVICDFCELNLPFSALQEHHKACGSRTTPCTDCKKYVMFSDLERHRSFCSAKYRLTNGSRVVIQCQFCKKSYAEDQLLQHQNSCSPLSRYIKGSHSRPNSVPRKKFQPSSAPSQLPFSFHSFEKTTWEQYQGTKTNKVKEFSFSSRNSPFARVTTEEPEAANQDDTWKRLHSSFPSRRMPQADADQLGDDFGTCSQCNIMLPNPTFTEHERKCRRLAALQNPSTKNGLETQKKMEELFL